MEISSKFYTNENRRTHTVKGVLGAEKVKTHLREIYASPDFQPDMDVLWDLREADFSSISTPDVKSIRNLVKNHWGIAGKSKGALVVSGDHEFGLSRMFGSLLEAASSSEVRVFRDMAKAKEWFLAREK